MIAHMDTTHQYVYTATQSKTFAHLLLDLQTFKLCQADSVEKRSRA